MPKKNFIVHWTKLSGRVTSALTLAGLMLLFGGSEASTNHCKPVHGQFINQEVVLTGSNNCNSPVGFCVSGQARGVLKGDFLSTVTSFNAAPNVADTNVYFVTANLVLHTRNGDLIMQENAASNQDPTHGDLGDVVTILDGTGRWAGATGHLRVWGKLSPTVSDVTYEGEVCSASEQD